ncbi:MAG: N-acetyl-alpha-D-glucosaminyl L-malate synthase BshA [Crocinitomicaceae bacterium]|jgi:N-acetyl-alpha-D-glucosaminyl L-malate synthase BshA|nr:N-acetyl-alpha-D-glucosaminyl L-malate synthase BshA [Crocinitomicaceae bacterium]
MKIGFVCYPTFGGSGVVATELGKALAEKGHELHFITYSAPARMGSLKSNLFYHEVRVSDYPLFEYQPYELVLTSKMVEITVAHDLDLLHVHYAIPHASAAIMARDILRAQGINIPVVTTLHGTDITLLGREPAFEPVISYAINRSDAVTAVSESLRSDTLELFGVERSIQVVNNFICTRHFEKDADEAFRKSIAPNGEPIIAHISNFRPVKRVHDVLEIFIRIRKNIPAKLLLVGDGPERSRIEKLALDAGVSEDVICIGKIKNPVEPLLISDLFLLPSETESFGLAALEALAAGVPVIASDAGGIPEVVEHGKSGYLAPVGDVERMSEHALFLLHNAEEMTRAKRMAKDRSLDFHIEKILPTYEAIYQRLMFAVNNPSEQ